MAETEQINKFFSKSEVVEVQRSELHLASYNPRTISERGKKELRKSIKKFGVVGGIVVNKYTGMTIVGGHQKVKVLDELNKYPDNDYTLRVELIDVDEKTEKELNITLNNPNVGGDWDYDKLREIIPDIDYKSAGLDEADLSMIGVDFTVQTQGEKDLAAALSDVVAPIVDEREREKQIRAEERAAMKAEMEQNGGDDDWEDAPKPEKRELTYEEKKQAVKEMKKQIMDKAVEKAANDEAYIVLSFDTFENKQMFCDNFGLNPYEKFFKGEDFQNKMEGFDE